MTRPEMAADDDRHGTWNGYNNYRCRCPRCRAARAVYDRDHKRRRRPRPAVAVDWLTDWQLDGTES